MLAAAVSVVVRIRAGAAFQPRVARKPLTPFDGEIGLARRRGG
jgi:hypothetical protein